MIKTFTKLLAATLLILASITPLQAAMAKTITMQVDGLVCAFCAQGIEKKLGAFPQSDGVYVNLENHLVAMGLKPDQDVTDEQLRETLTDAGYTVRTITRVETPLAELKAAHAKGGGQ